jgi:phenylpyruvate tautomerase
MPLLKLEITASLSDDKRKALLVALSRIVAEAIGKPEDYVMVTVSQAAMLMSGKPGEAAFVDLRSIGGLSHEVNRQLSQKLCRLLHESLGVPESRVYLNFTEVAASNWGWKRATFG